MDNSLVRDHLGVTCKGTSKTRDGCNIGYDYYVIGNLVVYTREKYYIMIRCLSPMLVARDSPEQSNNLKNCSELERFRLQIVEPQLMIECTTNLVDNVVTCTKTCDKGG